MEHPGVRYQVHVVAPADGIQGQQPQVALYLNLNIGRDAAEEGVVRSVFTDQEQLDLDIVLASLDVLFFILSADMPDKAQCRMVVQLLMDLAG